MCGDPKSLQPKKIISSPPLAVSTSPEKNATTACPVESPGFTHLLPLRRPSRQYLKILDYLKTSSSYYIDEEFPPASHIIDGRSGDSSKKVPRCLCGEIAQLKTTQSEKNYGRLYATCHYNSTWRMRLSEKPKLCKFFKFVDRKQMPPTDRARKAHFAPLQALPSSSASSSILSYTTSEATTKMKLWDKKLGPQASDVSQGALGDCWFLSAISVVASNNESRIRKLFSTSSPALSRGVFEITLFVDGRFVPVIIDSYLPITIPPVSKNSSPPRKRHKNSTTPSILIPSSSILPAPSPSTYPPTLSVRPMYSKTPSHNLWPALIEKAYAKAHGCYDSLSGGYVWEAFVDLLGAPVEVLYLGNYLTTDELDLVWTRLASFSHSNFVLGAACMVSDKEQGLVGCHAYSLLECREIFEDVIKGEQKKLLSFFDVKEGGGKIKGSEKRSNQSQPDHLLCPKRHITTPRIPSSNRIVCDVCGKPVARSLTYIYSCRTCDYDMCSECVNNQAQTTKKDNDNLDDEVIFLGSTNSAQLQPAPKSSNTSLRLIKLRNPWGKKEWSGDFGIGSDVWTKKLRKILKYDTYQDAHGEFWMPFDMFVKKFSSVDVCKVHDNNWLLESRLDSFSMPNRSGRASFIPSSSSYVIAPVEQGVWGYAMGVQPKRRNVSNMTKAYVDNNFLLLRRRKDAGRASTLEVVDLSLTGEQRINTQEFILEPKFEHVLVPFTTSSPNSPTPFRVCFYTAQRVNIVDQASFSIDLDKSVFEALLDLPPPAGIPHKHHPIGPNVVLKVVKLKASLYFFALNAAELDVCLKLEMKGEGFRKVRGDSSEIVIGAGKEKLLQGIVANGGDALSLHYEYLCDVKVEEAGRGAGGRGGGGGWNALFERTITNAGKKLCGVVSPPHTTAFGVGQGDILQIVGARGGL